VKVRVSHTPMCRYVRMRGGADTKRRIKAAKHNIRTTVRVNLRRGDWDYLPETTGQFYYS